VYYVECKTVPKTESDYGEFYIDPLLTATREVVLQVTGAESTCSTKHVPVEGTLRVFNGSYLLEEGTDYTIDYRTGLITLLYLFSKSTVLSADYRYVGESMGPLVWKENTSNYQVLPGVILAFGRQAQVGDIQAVVVSSDRVDTAEAYGGKFDMSFDLEVIAQDLDTQSEISTLVFRYLWSDKRPYLSAEGIEITNVGLGGEAEEMFDETSGIPMFTSSISVDVSADWEVHVPKPLTLLRAQVQSKDDVTENGPGLGVLMDASLLPTLVRSPSFERIL
jgi:hypothetical protein